MTILLFVSACFALNMAPGPNNLLSMANAKRYGIRTACCAGIGRLVAFVVMITLAATGLATLLYTSEKLFLVIKVAGGFYLTWLAFQLWTAGPADGGNEALGGKSFFQLMRQEFLLAAGNPLEVAAPLQHPVRLRAIGAASINIGSPGLRSLLW